MPVEHARNLFKLSEALLQDSLDDSHGEAQELRDEVEIYVKRKGQMELLVIQRTHATI